MIYLTRPFLRVAIICVFVLPCLSSCSDSPDDDLKTLRSLNETLHRSSEGFRQSTDHILETMEEKTQDPITTTAAKLWLSKAMVARSHSTAILDYIQHLKNAVETKAGTFSKRHRTLFDEADKQAANHALVASGKIKVLYKRLNEYSKAMLSIDPGMSGYFDNKLPAGIIIDQSEMDETAFTDLFEDVSALGAITMLAQLACNIESTANSFTRYCESRISSVTVVFDTYSGITGLSSHRVRPGEELEISAGVGAFSRAAMPRVLINGKETAVDDVSGYFFTKIRASTTPGEHTIPVKISFLDQQGMVNTIEKDLVYTVVKDSCR